MRKSRTLSVTLVLLLLVPSLLMAAPSTWAWAQKDASSEALEAPAETSVQEPEKLMKDSTDSKNTSDKDGWVLVKKSDLNAAYADIAEGNALNKKGGAAVDAAVETLKASTKDYRMFKPFAVVEGALYKGGFELGVGAGFIFKDALIAKLGVEKKNVLDMTDWLEWKNAYKATASIGIIF